MNIDIDIFSKIDLSPEEQRIKFELNDCVLVIKNIININKHKEKIIKYENFKSKIEEDGAMCLLFIHDSLPSDDLPTDTKQIYYEYLILKKDGRHESLCSKIYSLDNQKNRLDALESFYHKFDINNKIIPKEKNLSAMYVKYNTLYDSLIEKIFKRIMSKEKNHYKIRIKRYTDTDIIYEQLELSIFSKIGCTSYQSSIYPHLTFKQSKSTFDYEKTNLFIIYLKIYYGI